MLVCFSVISLGLKGHHDVKRRFGLRAEIKVHTCAAAEEPLRRLAALVPIGLTTTTTTTDAAAAKHLHRIISGPITRSGPRLFIKAADSKHHLKSKC